MSTIASSILTTAELPIIMVQHRRQEKIHRLIEQLETAIATGAPVQPALALLVKRNKDRVESAFHSRVEALQDKRFIARNRYTEHMNDVGVSTDELLSLRLALLECNETFGRAFAAYELYVIAAR